MVAPAEAPGLRVQVRYFAALRDVARCAAEELQLPADVSTVREFAAWLGRTRPELSEHLGTLRFAVDAEFATDEQLLTEQCEIALLPPFSGG